MTEAPMDLESANALFLHLQGIDHTPTGGSPDLSRSPKLSAAKAFSVIYFLQETLHVIPDTFEMCSRCHKLFNTEGEGIHVSEENYKTVLMNHVFRKRDIGKHLCDTCIESL